MLKETKGDPNKWRDISCSWTGRLNIVKKIALPRFIYAIPIRILVGFFAEICKLTMKMI